MALEASKQRTIEDAIRDGRKNRYVSAQFHLLKCVGLDRPNYEHKLLVKLLLHAGIDKIDNPVWTLPDDEVMAFIKCEKSSLLNALKACEACEDRHSLQSTDGRMRPTPEFLSDLASSLGVCGIPDCTPTIAWQVWIAVSEQLSALKKSTNETPS